MAQNYGEYDIPISHKRHKIVRLTLPQSRIQCLKIFTFPSDAIAKLHLYKTHFENVKEWLRMRWSGKSMVMTLNVISTVEEARIVPMETNEEIVTLKVTTDYFPQPTLDIYYQRLAQNNEKNIPFSHQIRSYIYFFQQFFEVILRGASIPNFFYTPSNLFLNRPQPFVHDSEISQLSVNYLSTVGLELLFLQGDIIREDLQEIFPLLPTNLGELMRRQKNEYVKELNKIIKMKALGWNILSFILQYVPNMLKLHDLREPIITCEAVLKLLTSQLGIYQSLLKGIDQKITQVNKITGIDFKWIFYQIFKKNCEEITWEDLYSKLFLENKIAKLKEEEYSRGGDRRFPLDQSTKISQQILNGFWQIQDEQIKNFYLQRSIPPSSTTYFLIRTNINFRKMMSHLNVLYFFDEAGFSSDLLEVHLAFMRNSYKRIEPTKLPPNFFPYHPKIPPPPSREELAKDRAKDSTENCLSAGEMSQALSRRVLTKDVTVSIKHEMLNTLDIIQRSLWK